MMFAVNESLKEPIQYFPLFTFSYKFTNSLVLIRCFKTKYYITSMPFSKKTSQKHDNQRTKNLYNLLDGQLILYLQNFMPNFNFFAKIKNRFSFEETAYPLRVSEII
jgi:hypothetical protein